MERQRLRKTPLTMPGLSRHIAPMRNGWRHWNILNINWLHSATHHNSSFGYSMRNSIVPYKEMKSRDCGLKRMKYIPFTDFVSSVHSWMPLNLQETSIVRLVVVWMAMVNDARFVRKGAGMCKRVLCPLFENKISIYDDNFRVLSSLNTQKRASARVRENRIWSYKLLCYDS